MKSYLNFSRYVLLLFLVSPCITYGGVLPIVESFENSSFPSSGWFISNPNANTTWIRSTFAASYGIASVSFDNLAVDANIGERDLLGTTSIDFRYGVNALTELVFSRAYAPRELFGQTISDTLSVIASIDSGLTWTTIWSKSGSDLATAPTLPTGSTFTPTANEWATTVVNVGSLYQGKAAVLFAFENRCGRGGKIWIDNVVILNTIPLSLEDNNSGSKVELKLFPNPSQDFTTLQMELKQKQDIGAVMYDMLGKVVWSKYFKSIESITEIIQLDNIRAGQYIIKIQSGINVYTRYITKE